MAGFFSNLRNVIIVSLILAAIFIAGFGLHGSGGFGILFATAVLRWLHVVCGIMWIGLLYYFNFVQIRVMPEMPAELKPGVTRYIAPEALFWFRWAAFFTVAFGLVLAWLRGYVVSNYPAEVLSLGFFGGFDPHNDVQFAFMGAGMWLGIIMMLNVWHFIWPAQKIALGLRDGFTPEQKAAAARKAMIFSRVNTLLSLPMLVAMTMYQTIFG